MLRKLLNITIFVLSLFFLWGCSNVDLSKFEVTLALDYTPNTNHTGIFVAKDLGYYADEGIEVSIVQPPENGALSFLACGNADFAISFEEEVLIARNSSTPLSIIAIAAIIEHNTGGIISLKHEGITRFKLMEAKSFKSLNMRVYDEIVKECVVSDGGDPNLIIFVPNSELDAITALGKGFDMSWVYEGWDKIIADIKGIETNFLPLTGASPLFDYYSPILVTQESILNQRRHMVEGFLRATKRGYEYAKMNPRQSADILIKYTPETNPEIIYASQFFLSERYFTSNWGHIEEDRWTAFFDWLKNKDIIPKNSTKALQNFY